MDAVDWTLVVSLAANLLMAWQLWQQKHEFNHSKRESLISTVKASMKALYSYGLQLRAFGQQKSIDPQSEQGRRLKKSIDETDATYQELEEILKRLISDKKIPGNEFDQIWSLVHAASGQIDEIGQIFEVAAQLNAPRA